MDVSEEWEHLLNKIYAEEPDWNKSYETELELPQDITETEKEELITALGVRFETESDLEDYLSESHRQARKKPTRTRSTKYYYEAKATTTKPFSRAMKAACSCRLGCYKRVTDADRRDLFHEFWSLPSHASRWHFIGFYVAVVPKARTRVEDSRRANTRIYTFELRQTGRVEVCKTMFLNTLGISSAWVSTACAKIAQNGFVNGDKRGKKRKVSEPF